MTVVLVVVLGLSAMAFYLRFLVALCRERKLQAGGYWVRLRIESNEDGATAQEQQQRVPESHVA
jgi:hypothetical protein